MAPRKTPLPQPVGVVVSSLPVQRVVLLVRQQQEAVAMLWGLDGFLRVFHQPPGFIGQFLKRRAGCMQHYVHVSRINLLGEKATIYPQLADSSLGGKIAAEAFQ